MHDVTQRRLCSVGLETEFGELVDGGNLYTPEVGLEAVVLGRDVLQTILDTVENFKEFQRLRTRCGLDDVVAYGRGLMLLFFGDSGTGKTLTANAVAARLVSLPPPPRRPLPDTRILGHLKRCGVSL